MFFKAILPAVAAIVLATGAHASTLTFSTFVTGDQEVAGTGPFTPIDTGSDAVGFGTVVVDTYAQTFDVSLLVTGITLDDLNDGLINTAGIGPVHLHNAPSDANGAIVVPFDFAANDYLNQPNVLGAPALGFSLVALGLDASNIINLGGFDELVAELSAGNIYFNVHTDTFGGGEIRGQLPGVNEVPLPASGLLLGGMVAFGAWRGRAKKKAA